MNGWRGIIIISWLILLVFAGTGCSDKNGVPSGILPRDKMEAVLWDMAQADQYAALYLAKDSAHIDRKMETLRLYEQVFRLHGVSRELFRKSYQYYLDHPTLDRLLFDSVIAAGSRARSESYDRPGPFHPPAVTMPGKPAGGAVVPPRAAGGVMPKGPAAARPFHPPLHPPAKKDTTRKGS